MNIKVKEVTKHKRSWHKGMFPRMHDKPRLFISLRGESILENFACRMDRPVEVFKTCLPEILEKLGLPKETRARWSQKAGCNMCPCSPGFILTVPGCDPDFGWDAWATLAGVEQPITERTVDRAMQLKNDPTMPWNAKS